MHPNRCAKLNVSIKTLWGRINIKRGHMTRLTRINLNNAFKNKKYKVNKYSIINLF